MTVADRCPGVLRPHPAEDGLLVRLRIPGGQTIGTTLGAVADLAVRYGNGELQLTSRSSLQIRGLVDPVPAELTSELASLGFLPSPRHDRVRNIVASPLTGISGGHADVRGMITELDRALLAEDALAELPGRFLFALDDGRGDVSALPFDLGYLAASPTRGELLLGSSRCRVPVSAAEAVSTLIGLANAFLCAQRAASGRAWHVGELPAWAENHAVRIVDSARFVPVEPPLGAVGGAASVHVPLGLLTQRQAAAVVAAAGTGPVVVTPWRGLIVPGAAAELPALVHADLVSNAQSGWALVSACVGAPYCSRTTLDTRSAAIDLVRNGLRERTHVSGCERRCGAPTGSHRAVLPSVGVVR